MVAIKANQAEAFLARANANVRAVLVYGPDAGLVSERAQKLSKRLAEREQPHGEIVRLDDADLENDPERLAVELLTIPMFGGSKIVRATASRRVTAAGLKPLLEGAPMPGALVVEAGNLRPDDSLRQLFERASIAAAVPCFPDEARDLEGMIQEVLSTHRLTISPDARQLLLTRLGADRGLSRGEVEKLALYVLGRATIDVDDVEAIVGDAAELALDQVVDAAATGKADRALLAYDRLVAAGESPQMMIAAAQSHFARIHRLRTAVDRGRSFDEVVRQMRPPVHFKRQTALQAQCRAWTTERALAAVKRIRIAALQARRSSATEVLAGERLLLEIAYLAVPDTARGTSRR